jgi:UTP:GlnB (protein PII) uridylyltransferase
MPDFNGPARLSVPPGSTAPHAAWSEVTPLANQGADQGADQGAFRVRLGGFFGPAWMANLCTAMADHRLSINRAHAMRARNGSWMAELTLLSLDGASDPHTLPYVALAEALDPGEVGALALDRFELVETTDHGGCLRLTFEAKDVLGLLGSLLAQLADLGMFPLEMHIDTREGRANDCLWLATQNGEVPAPEVRTELAQWLKSSLRKRA